MKIQENSPIISGYTVQPTEAPCVNKINNCVQYGADICSNPDYAGWVKTNCRKFCNICSMYSNEMCLMY